MGFVSQCPGSQVLSKKELCGKLDFCVNMISKNEISTTLVFEKSNVGWFFWFESIGLVKLSLSCLNISPFFALDNLHFCQPLG